MKARHGWNPRRSRPGRRFGTATGLPSKAAVIISAAICLIAVTFPPLRWPEPSPAAQWADRERLDSQQRL